MCAFNDGLLACSVEGQLFFIVCKKCSTIPNIITRNPNNPKVHSLEVISQQRVCCNCSVIRYFKLQKEYIILGTEEGSIHMYEIFSNSKKLV